VLVTSDDDLLLVPVDSSEVNLIKPFSSFNPIFSAFAIKIGTFKVIFLLH